MRLLRGDIAQHALVVRFIESIVSADLRQIGLGVVERDLELARIEPVEHLPGVDVLVVVYRDVLDDAGDVGRNGDLLGVDIGVVGRHHLAAGDVPIAADDEHHRHQRKQLQRIHCRRRRDARRRSAFAAPAASWRDSSSAWRPRRGGSAPRHARAIRSCERRSAIAAFSHAAALALLNEPGADFPSPSRVASTIRSTSSRLHTGKRRGHRFFAEDRRAARAAAAPPRSDTAAWRDDRSDRCGARSVHCRKPSSRRVRVIGCRSSISASSACLRPSHRSRRTRTAHWARVMPNWPAL